MISAVILTKNEEVNIVDCLESLAFCDEVIIVDDTSDDRTVELAQRTKARVFSRVLEGDFSAQRNFGLEKAKGGWVLFIDADERISTSLRDEIKSEIRNPKSEFAGYRIRRIDFMWGKELRYGETGNMKLLRLARKDKGIWEGKVHETWKIKGTIGDLENAIRHYPHQTITEFLKEINFYTDLRAKELYDKGIQANFWSIILYSKAKFFLNYFLKQGFRDGLVGLILALMMSFHSFLVRGKLWLLWQKR